MRPNAPPKQRSGPATTPGRPTIQPPAATIDRASVPPLPGTGCHAPAPLTGAAAELLDRISERALWQRVCLARERAAYECGHRDGVEAGRRAEAAERDRAWNEIARPIARGGPAYAALERIRWELRGEPRIRETFAEPHPADYRGRDGEAA